MSMKNSWLNYLCLLFFCLSVQLKSFSQYHPNKKCNVDVNNECVPNTILTAVPFLKIVPDARSGSMGDVGLATSPDANSIHFNASKLAFAKQKFSISGTYTPWLRELGLTDVYLAFLSGYNKIAENQTIGFSMKFFSLGDINFTDLNGMITGSGRPREIEVSAAYARKLGDNLSAAVTGKYIYSNLASGQQVLGVDIRSANVLAADVSLTYQTEIGQNKNEFIFATAISNIGSKIAYSERSEINDFLPTNFGIGASYSLNVNPHNRINLAADVNKLLVPTPQPFRLIENPGQANERIIDNPDFDQTGAENGGPDGIGDYRQKSIFSGIFGSFTDARGGLTEELRELTYSLGAEYIYNGRFALRSGYYFEDELKGDRQYLTMGLGIKYKVASIDFSYLIPTSNRRSPLDNTLRFSFIFDASVFQTR